MMQKMISLACLMAAALFVPTALIATRLATGEGMADLLTSSSIIIIYYIPVLAMVSVLRPHFTPQMAVWPFAIILVLELWAFVPGHAPFDMLGRAVTEFYPRGDPAVLGKSAFLGAGALLAGLSLLHKVTIFRLVATIMAAAQCMVVVLFHITVLIWPLEGLKQQEISLVRSLVETKSGFEDLCDLDGRACFRGNLEQARAWSLSEMRAPSLALSLIDDTSQYPRLLHTWTENPTPGAMDRVSLVTAHKYATDDIALMISRDGPSMVYAELRKSIGILLAAFHTAWIAIGIAILGRHGRYAFRRGRWQRDT